METVRVMEAETVASAKVSVEIFTGPAGASYSASVFVYIGIAGLVCGIAAIPTLVLWAMQDIALPPELIDGLADYIADLRLERVEGASHWIVHERPAFVAQRLAAFLQA